MKPPTPRAFPVPHPSWTGLDCFGSNSSICEKAWIAVVLRRSFGVLFFFPFCFVFYATTLKEGAFQHSLHLPHSKPIKVNSFPHCHELPREEARLSDFFFSVMMAVISGLSLLNFDTHPPLPPAGCSTGQRLCIINDIQIPCLKGLVCGLDESISVLPLPSLGG